MKTIFKLFALAVLLASTTASAALGGLTVFQGERSVLESHTGKGKWTIVMIWASDCHICNVEAESYIQFHEQHKDRDATILGMSTDGPSGMKEAQAYVDRHHVTFPTLIAERDQVVRLYAELTGVYMAGTPAFLIFDPQGELKAQQVGAVPTELIENFINNN